MSELIKNYHCQGKPHTQEQVQARWIAYYYSPPGAFMYLCDDCLTVTVIENDLSFPNRLIEIRFLPDALNQIGGSGVLASLPKRT